MGYKKFMFITSYCSLRELNLNTKWVSQKQCFMALGRVSHSFRGTTYPGKTLSWLRGKFTPRYKQQEFMTIPPKLISNTTFPAKLSSIQDLSDNISEKQRSSLKTLPVKGETDSTGHSKVRLVQQPHPVSGSLADQLPLHLAHQLLTGPLGGVRDSQ